jgi:hypothetical protein
MRSTWWLLSWIVAVCINQEDIEEKNVQVALMGAIYSKARGIIGYIGPAPAGKNPKTPFWALAWAANAFVDRQDDVPEEVKNDGDSGMGVLWAHQWFRRSWVTQEVVLSKKVICLYGSGKTHFTLDFDLLGSFVYMYQHADHHREDWFRVISDRSDYEAQLEHAASAVQVYSWAQLRTQRKEEPHGLDLIKVLNSIRPAGATDERDKVYSILGLLKEKDRAGIRVEYSRDHSVEQVYTELAKYCIGTPYIMRLLEHASTTRKRSGLPSWAPDWSHYPRYPLDSRLYKCAGDTTPKASLSPDGKKVILQGFTFDKVAVLGVLITYPHAVMEGPAGPITDSNVIVIGLEELAYQMCEGARARFGRYPANEDPNDIIWRTLTADRGWGDRRSTREDRKFYDAFRAQNPGRAYQDPAPQASEADYSSEQPDAAFLMMTIHFQRGRVLCVTAAGRLGVVPADAKPGDWITVFSGGNLPFVIRNIKGNEFTLVGHCYVHGVMDGEIIEALNRTPGLRDVPFEELALV